MPEKKRPAQRSRELAGNATTLPPDEFVYPSFINLSLAQRDEPADDGKLPLQSRANVIAAKRFVDQNEK